MPELRAAIIAEGDQIIDAAFAPKGERIIDGLTGDEIGAEKPSLTAT